MKVIIESENTKEAMRLINSFNMACAIFEIKVNLRKRLLNAVEHYSFDSNEDVVEWVIEKINAELEGINIDELIE